MKNAVKVLVVDCYPLVRQGIIACIAEQESMEIVGEAAEGHEALRMACDLKPDLILMTSNQFMRDQSEVNTPKLTNRERQVLAQIADGLRNKEIASQLGVGVRTVETHREHIMRKLDIHNVAGLTKFAIANGLVSLEITVTVV